MNPTHVRTMTSRRVMATYAMIALRYISCTLAGTRQPEVKRKLERRVNTQPERGVHAASTHDLLARPSTTRTHDWIRTVKRRERRAPAGPQWHRSRLASLCSAG